MRQVVFEISDARRIHRQVVEQLLSWGRAVRFEWFSLAREEKPTYSSSIMEERVRQSVILSMKIKVAASRAD
jgi:hypothetical protein